MKESGMAGVAVVLLLAVSAGCVATSRYAVRSTVADAESPESCYRQCQATRTGGLEAYLGCARACPGVSVTDGECQKTADDATGRVCADESYTHPDHEATVAVTVLMSVIAVGITYAAYPTTP